VFCNDEPELALLLAELLPVALVALDAEFVPFIVSSSCCDTVVPALPIGVVKGVLLSFRW
jgi:hypothetical protein